MKESKFYINKCKTELLLGIQLEKKACEYNLGYMQASSNVGKREKQEDSVLILEHPQNKEIKFLAVADGVGGEKNSEQASQYLLQELMIKFEITPALYYKDLNYINKILNKKISEINQEIKKQKYGATTLSLAVVNEKETLILNIGDSRVYTYETDLKQETIDDSCVQLYYEYGIIPTKDLMRFHKYSNEITKAIGAKDVVELNEKIIPNNYEYLILTTDGVTDCISEQELKDELINSKNISKAQRIVEKAITTTSYCDKGHEYIDKIEGGKDNTTCAILKRK